MIDVATIDETTVNGYREGYSEVLIQHLSKKLGWSYDLTRRARCVTRSGSWDCARSHPSVRRRPTRSSLTSPGSRGSWSRQRSLTRSWTRSF